MEQVVYFLGAGFSAPLEIPVIRTFLIKAKDIFYSDQSKYAKLATVLQEIEAMSNSVNYYKIDLFNIEEILSILQMEDQVTGNDRSALFKEFIKIVIKASTPSIDEPHLQKDKWLYLPLDDNFAKSIFGREGNIMNRYGQFVANLMNLKLTTNGVDFQGAQRVEIVPSIESNPRAQYTIVTLNYDLVIENFMDHIRRHFPRPNQVALSELKLPSVWKLHGSVDTDIVAPTWKKLASKDLNKQWRNAHEALREANHIRIIGYSLQQTDSYVRYLLASAVLKSKHLKSIDIICKDDQREQVMRRYREFVRFEYAQFANQDVDLYLGQSSWQLVITQRQENQCGTTYSAHFDRLEDNHESFMKERARLLHTT